MLGAPGAQLAAPLLARLDEIAGDAAAAEDGAGGEAGGSELAAARRGAEGALGAAVRSLGPEAVLDTLPLRLEEVHIMVLAVRHGFDDATCCAVSSETALHQCKLCSWFRSTRPCSLDPADRPGTGPGY